jgi:hypothetical protein
MLRIGAIVDAHAGVKDTGVGNVRNRDATNQNRAGERAGNSRPMSALVYSL